MPSPGRRLARWMLTKSLLSITCPDRVWLLPLVPPSSSASLQARDFLVLLWPPRGQEVLHMALWQAGV